MVSGLIVSQESPSQLVLNKREIPTSGQIFKEVIEMKNYLRSHPKWWEVGTLLCVGVLPALLLFSFLRGRASSQTAPPQDWQAPVIEVKQLPAGENGVIPVEILRAK